MDAPRKAQGHAGVARPRSGGAGAEWSISPRASSASSARGIFGCNMTFVPLAGMFAAGNHAMINRASSRRRRRAYRADIPLRVRRDRSCGLHRRARGGHGIRGTALRSSSVHRCDISRLSCSARRRRKIGATTLELGGKCRSSSGAPPISSLPPSASCWASR